MLRIVRSKKARHDLINIWKYIAVDDAEAADRQLDLIDERIALLAKHPLLGPARDDIRLGLRVLVVGQYVILYKLAPHQILIVRLLHSRRDLVGIFTS